VNTTKITKHLTVDNDLWNNSSCINMSYYDDYGKQITEEFLTKDKAIKLINKLTSLHGIGIVDLVFNKEEVD